MTTYPLYNHLPIIAKRQETQAIGCINESNSTLVIDINKLYDIESSTNTYTLDFSSYQDLDPETKLYIDKHFYINGTSFELCRNKSAIIETSKGMDAVFVIYCDDFNPDYDFTFTCDITVKSSKTRKTFTIYHTSTAQETLSYDLTGVNTKSKNSAFALLRTNPKLTGNIKIVVESDDKLYLDTFKKVSSRSLSNAHYQKRSLLSNGDYPSDIFRAFGKLDSNTLMDLNSDCYDPYKKYNNPEDCVITEYEYGADLNSNNLYNGRFKLLAPLHVGEEMPDYFLIFAIPQETTSPFIALKPKPLSLSSLYEFRFIRENPAKYNELLTLLNKIQSGKLIKVFNLKKQTKLGSYIQTYAEKASDKSLHNIYYNGQIKGQIIKNVDTIFGIDYKYGVFTTKNVRHPKTENIEQLNSHYADAFKSAGLIYPWILNLEFLFDDPEAQTFGLTNYFGFYVSENEFQHISQVINSNNSITGIREYYNEHKLLDTKKIVDKALEEYDKDNAIFSISSEKNFNLLKSYNGFEEFAKENVLNKPASLIACPSVEKFEFNDIKSFLTMKFDRQIQAGEHFRFIIGNPLQLYKGATIFEIIASNDYNLTRNSSCISPYILTNRLKEINVYSLNFYVYKDDGSDELETLKTQISRLAECIRKFKSFLSVEYSGKDSISVVSLEPVVLFQHICAPCVQDDTSDYIHYFNCSRDSKLLDSNMYNEDFYIPFNNPVYDTNDRRLSSMVRFVETSTFSGLQLYTIQEEIDDDINRSNLPIYKTSTSGYKPLSSINILDQEEISLFNEISRDYITENSTFIFLSPYSADKHFIALPEDPALYNRQLYIYNSAEVSMGILSFLDVKDFDFQIDSPRTEEIISNDSLDFKQGDNALSSLKKFCCYYVEKGGFTSPAVLSGTTFMLLGENKILTFNKKRYYISEIDNNGLITKEETKLIYYDPRSSYGYKTSYELPGMLSSKLFKKAKTYLLRTRLGYSNKLLTPILPATAFNWKSTGVSFDGNSVLNTNDVSEYRQNKLTGAFYDTGAMPDIKSLDESVYYKGEILSVREFILKFPDKLKSLYSSVPTAICSYNKISGSIQFVYNNIRFDINLANAMQDINYVFPKNFENIEVAVINDFNVSRHNELFISDDQRFILMVNHSYFTDNDYKGSKNIKIYNGNGIYETGYYWAETGYSFDLINAYYKDTKFMTPVKTTDGINEDLYNSIEDNTQFVQIGYPLYEHTADLIEPGLYFQLLSKKADITYNSHVGNIAEIPNMSVLFGHDLWSAERFNKVALLGGTGLSTYFNLAYRYDPNNFMNIFNENVNDGIVDYDVIDKRDSRKYQNILINNIDDNSPTERLNTSELVRWAKSLYQNNLDVYIINNDDYYKYSAENIIDITAPNAYNRFPSFFIEPNFIPRIEFRSTESLQKKFDMNLRNTGTIPYNITHIDAYPYHIISQFKAVTLDADLTATVHPGSLIGLPIGSNKTKNFAFDSKNILATSQKIKIKNSKSNSLYNQALSTQKSFFGSCAPNIPYGDLVISLTNNMFKAKAVPLQGTQEWNATFGDINSNRFNRNNPKTYIVTINLTDAAISHISAQAGFLSAWTLMLKALSLNKASMVDYIKKQILGYYNFEETSVSLIAQTNTTGVLRLPSKVTIDNNKVEIKMLSNGDYVMELRFTGNYTLSSIQPTITIKQH